MSPLVAQSTTSAPLLAMDTSGLTARVALVSPTGETLAAAARTGDRHSVYLLPLCHELLQTAGLKVSGLAAVACGRGPGSFTGLRVGMALAKGLCLPSDLPLVLVSSLEALALQMAAERPAAPLLVPAIDAGKGEVYAQLFVRAEEGVVPTGPEQRLLPSALVTQLREGASPATSQAVLAGGGVDRHRAALTEALGEAALVPDFPGPSAEAIARLAWARFQRGERDDLASAVPSYGRPPDITKSKKPGR